MWDLFFVVRGERMNRLRWLWLTPVAFFVLRVLGGQLIEGDFLGAELKDDAAARERVLQDGNVPGLTHLESNLGSTP